MATAAGSAELNGRLAHNFHTTMFSHLDFSHTRQGACVAIAHCVDYPPTIVFHLLICCLEIKNKMKKKTWEDATYWNALDVRLKFGGNEK